MDSTAVKDGGIDGNDCSPERGKTEGLESDGNFVIDVDCNGGNSSVGNKSCNVKEEEKMCRICHMTSDSLSQSGDLIQLGCRCRNDLGTAHRNCAELWFATKGNRVCEICGVVAKNVSGLGNSNFILEFNDALRTPYSYRSSEQRYHPVCAFIGAIIIMFMAVHWLFYKKPHFP